MRSYEKCRVRQGLPKTKRTKLLFLLSALMFVVATFFWYKDKQAEAQRGVCRQRMSWLGKALLLYADAGNGKFPTPSKWCDSLTEYLESTKKMLSCPSAPEGPCNYGMNENVEKLSMTHFPSDIVLLFETRPGWNQSGGPDILTTDYHGGKGCHIVFRDLHVEFVRTEELDDLRWTPD